MDRQSLLAFARTAKFWVEASASAAGAPQAAVVGVAVSDDFELVFDTIGTTRKAKNLRANPHIALVMWNDAKTLQIDGIADEPTDVELARIKKVYFATFTDGPEREGWADITYFRVRPTWIRYSDFGGASPTIVELSDGL
jgi:pyridoxine/pyridoxamine 5'-phosphate oxidase